MGYEELIELRGALREAEEDELRFLVERMLLDYGVFFVNLTVRLAEEAERVELDATLQNSLT